MSKPVELDLEDAAVSLTDRFLDEPTADRAFADLEREVDWQRREIVLFGRRVMQPRLVAWIGDPAADYTYSGATFEPAAWTPAVAALRDRVAAEASALGLAFRPNSVLCNLYRDGADSVSWHADDEPELGIEPVIASLSLGSVRRFVLRRKDDRAHRVVLELPHGSLLWMHGPTQRSWQHALPKTARPVGPRINLTFREIRPV